jgi:hypothetical protein
MDFSQLVPRKGLSQQYTPEELFAKFEEYVTHNQTDGLIWIWERVKYKNSSQLEPTPKRAPLTTKAFCLFARMSHSTFSNYLNPQSSTYKDFNEVAQYIKDACDVDVFNGASVGSFNGNLAAAVIKQGFGLTDNDGESRRVDVIRHDILFSDYTDVTNQGALPPSQAELTEFTESTEESAATTDVPKSIEEGKQEEAEKARVVSGADRLQELNAASRQERPEAWEYDNLPNTSSRHHNMSEYRERNGIVDD